MCQISSMRRGNDVGASTWLITSIQNLSFEGEASKDEDDLHFWDNWSNDVNECQEMKQRVEDIRAAMQLFHVKVHHIMPIHVPGVIHRSDHQPAAFKVKPDQNAGS